jgi:hypothetical protein
MELAKCARCGGETQLYQQNIPICLACIEAEEKVRERREHPRAPDLKTKAANR